MHAELAGHLPGEEMEFGEYVGQEYAVARPEAIVRILAVLKERMDFDFLVDLTAVDYPKRAERFDLIYILYSFGSNRRYRIKTRLGGNVHATSVTSVYKTANWLEREVFDMFGIVFDGHPNLKRILMPEGWEGFPLRKDYSIIHQDAGWVQGHLGIESGQ